MKRSKKLLALALIPLMATTIGLTSCGSSGDGDGNGQQQVEKMSITWTVPSEATVSVEGYEAMPSEVDKDTSISFTVTAKTGYEINVVKVNNKRLTPKNNKYTTKITATTKIEVVVKESIQKIEIVNKPTKLKYFAGESIDTTGMEVKATYKTGTTKIIKQGADGYSITPSTFEGGETEFKVLYEGQEATVALDDRVEYLVTIDVDGGTLSETYVETLKAKNLKNFNIAENGNITFSYFTDLQGEILMPTETDISKPEYEFLSWEGAVSKITASTKKSITMKAKFQIGLVDVEKIFISTEVVDGKETPFLNIEGFFGAANEVQLYLFEGNDNVEFKGEIFKGQKGDQFKCKFNIFDLQNSTTEDGQSYEGKWMDIKFAAKVGEETVTMEIFEQGSYEIDTTQKAAIGNYVYAFAVYEGAVKLYYFYSVATYEISIGQALVEDTKKDVLKITGKFDTKFANKFAKLTWFGEGESDPYTSNIGAQGEFEFRLPLQDFTLIKKNYFAHITIVESETDDTIVYGGTNTNLAHGGCVTKFDKLPSKKGDFTNAVGGGYKSELNGYTYYVGYGWDGLMIYVVDIDLSFDKVTLEKKEDGVYYTFSGKYESGKKDLELNFAFEFQHNDNVDHLGWDVVYKNYYKDGEEGTDAYFKATIDEANSTFTYSIRVDNLFSTYNKEDKWVLTPHIGLDENGLGDLKAKEYTTEIVTFEGVNYSIQQDDSTWNCTSLVMEKAQ